MREITLRSLALGAVLALLFTAANTYLGLKVGLTFATSIPAAVISMSLLRIFKESSILENNIVQTIASVGGTIAAIIFVLPALIILGFWQGFPFWQTFLLTTIGGILGVLFTIPLRRALVVNSNLPYPEGVAAAETLRIRQYADSEEDSVGNPVRDISLAGGISFLFNFIVNGLKLLPGSMSYFGKLGSIVTGLGFQFSFALVGAGYLIGIQAGLSILLGIILTWGILVPIFSLHHLTPDVSMAHIAMQVWAEKIRFVGAGVLGVASIWIIVKLIRPLCSAVIDSINTSRKRRLNQHYTIETHEQDIPIVWILIGVGILVLPLIGIFSYFTHTTAVILSPSLLITVIVLSVFLVVIIGFLTAGAAGYMAGLVGSSYCPISGIAILATIVVALFLSYLFKAGFHVHMDHRILHYAIALTIIITSTVIASACVSNDNLQDLKTGHLVGATPWKQQVTLIFGITVGSLILAPVLNGLYHAYGFAGALPYPGMNPKLALSAPQATLMATLAQGIITHHMHWNMLFIGIIIGIIFMLFNELILAPKGIPSISLFAIGLAIYLPSEISLPLFGGTVLSWIVKSKLVKEEDSYQELIKRCGVLIACGLIVGESIFGLINATMVVAGVGHQTAHSYSIIHTLLVAIIFFAVCWGIYLYIKRFRDSLFKTHVRK